METRKAMLNCNCPEVHTLRGKADNAHSMRVHTLIHIHGLTGHVCTHMCIQA